MGASEEDSGVIGEEEGASLEVRGNLVGDTVPSDAASEARDSASEGVEGRPVDGAGASDEEETESPVVELGLPPSVNGACVVTASLASFSSSTLGCETGESVRVVGSSVTGAPSSRSGSLADEPSSGAAVEET